MTIYKFISTRDQLKSSGKLNRYLLKKKKTKNITFYAKEIT